MREVRGRALGELDELCKMVSSCEIKMNGIDKWKWVLGKEGRFSVRELRGLIDDRTLRETRNRMETVWCRVVPKKVSIFIWRLRNERIPVREVIDYMGIDIHSVLCPCCDEDIKSITHCFLKCKFIKELWHKIFLWWGVGWVNDISMEELIMHDGADSFSKYKKVFWRACVWSSL